MCVWCGETFQIYLKQRPNARFCSAACYGKWQSEHCRRENARNWQGGKVTLTCKQCGNPYQRGRPAVKGSNFCSRKCTDQWKSIHQRGENHPDWAGRVTLICRQCGQLFDVKPCLAKGSRARIFCSLACRRREKKRVVCTCEWCGKTFERLPSETENARFCSRSCLAKSRTGERAANWKGGISFEPYPLEFNERFKRQIRERDLHTCAVCRLFGKDVHHMDYNKNNTVSENCITLCHVCHTVTNGNRTYWQAALLGLLEARSEYALEARYG